MLTKLFKLLDSIENRRVYGEGFEGWHTFENIVDDVEDTVRLIAEKTTGRFMLGMRSVRFESESDAITFVLGSE